MFCKGSLVLWGKVPHKHLENTKKTFHKNISRIFPPNGFKTFREPRTLSEHTKNKWFKRSVRVIYQLTPQNFALLVNFGPLVEHSECPSSWSVMDQRLTQVSLYGRVLYKGLISWLGWSNIGTPLANISLFFYINQCWCNKFTLGKSFFQRKTNGCMISMRKIKQIWNMD